MKSTNHIDRGREEAVRDKYREERAKRIRAEGTGQYIHLAEESPYLVDPFVAGPAQRAPQERHIEVVIIGGGFSGVLTADSLSKVGIDDYLVIEKGADVGGTWYWNRYPGVRCDVESYIYMPLLEETGYVPTERYSTGAEIFEYGQSLALRLGLYDKALLQTRVVEARWEDDEAAWVLSTDVGDRIVAQYLVLATGALLTRPKLPGIRGLEDFKGRAFHTSRWDYDYTGGNASGNLAGLRDKRVAVIGTGSTGIQVIPMVAQDAGHLYVFQRTPSIVDERGNRPTNPEWFSRLRPGWQERRKANLDKVLTGVVQAKDEDEVTDQWGAIWGATTSSGPGDAASASVTQEELDLLQMERIRARVSDLVEDPLTAESLKPWYGRFCKRPCFHDSFLTTFNRDNVTLIDTQGRGVERISAHALHVDGKAYEVDCIIFATGFELAMSPARAGGFPVLGRDGVSLDEKWAHGVHSVHGIYTDGFPNAFVVGSARQSVVSVNVPTRIAVHADHVAHVLSELRTRGVRTMEMTTDAVSHWTQLIRARSTFREEYARACTPGYFNNEGKVDADLPVQATAFGGSVGEFVEILREWRDTGIDTDAVLT